MRGTGASLGVLRCSLSVALEALVRWDHPAHGLQGPFVFITIAEESGLTVPLGAAMLSQACEQLRAWRGTALGHITIAVNVSPVQLAHAGFTDTVADTLQSTGVDGAQIVFEITESTLMTDPEATLGTLQRIKALGIRIAVDDSACRGRGRGNRRTGRNGHCHGLHLAAGFLVREACGCGRGGCLASRTDRGSSATGRSGGSAGLIRCARRCGASQSTI